MGLKDALGLGDEEPPLAMPDDAHAHGDHEAPLGGREDGDDGAVMPFTPPPPD